MTTLVKLFKHGIPVLLQAIAAQTYMVAMFSAITTNVVQAEGVTQAQAASGLYQAHQEWLNRNRNVPQIAIGGKHDTLVEYAKKQVARIKLCEIRGVVVPIIQDSATPHLGYAGWNCLSPVAR